MRSSLVPDQIVMNVNAYIAQYFAIVFTTVYHSTCNLSSYQGRAFHWLGEKVPESARK